MSTAAALFIGLLLGGIAGVAIMVVLVGILLQPDIKDDEEETKQP